MLSETRLCNKDKKYTYPNWPGSSCGYTYQFSLTLLLHLIYGENYLYKNRILYAVLHKNIFLCCVSFSHANCIKTLQRNQLNIISKHSK